MTVKHIFIYGAPGAGKTTVSDALQDKTKIPIVHGDFIREFPGTKSAWRKYGSLTKKNVVSGLDYVREYMSADVSIIFSKADRTIFEAVFIDPDQYYDKTNVFLIVTLDEDEHREHFFEPVYRKETDETKENFLAVRMIQDYLIEEAKSLNVKVIHNTDSTMKALDELILEL